MNRQMIVFPRVATWTESEDQHAGIRVTRLTAATPSEFAPSGFGRTYEAVADALTEHSEVALEPDGSLVWASREAPHRQLFAQITDNGHEVTCVHLQGTALWSEWDWLRRSLGWPATRLMAQWLPEGFWVAESSAEELWDHRDDGSEPG